MRQYIASDINKSKLTYQTQERRKIENDKGRVLQQRQIQELFLDRRGCDVSGFCFRWRPENGTDNNTIQNDPTDQPHGSWKRE